METETGFNPAAYGVTAFFVTAAGTTGGQTFSQKDLNGTGRFWFQYVSTGGNSTFLGNLNTGIFTSTITTQVLHTIFCNPGSNQTLQLIRNRNASSATGTRTLEATDGAFRVGSNKADPPTSFYEGQIAEIILYGQMPYSQMVIVWDYLNRKWSVY